MTRFSAPHAAAVLWQRYHPDLKSLLQNVLRDDAEAGDALAQTYEVLVRAWPRMQVVPADERTFVLGVAANVARHVVRRRQRDARLRDTLKGASVPSAVRDPEALVGSKQLHAELEWALTQLSVDQQSTVRQLLDGESAADISRAQGIPEATVRSRAMLARRRLKQLLSKRWVVLALGALLATSMAWAAYRLIVARRAAAALTPSAATRSALDRPVSPTPNERLSSSDVVPPSPAATSASRLKAPRSPVRTPAPPTVTEVFGRANRAHFVERDLVAAVEGWRTFIEQFPDSTLADDARLNLATAHFRLGHLAEARAAASEALRVNGASPHRADLEALIALLDAAQR